MRGKRIRLFLLSAGVLALCGGAASAAASPPPGGPPPGSLTLSSPGFLPSQSPPVSQPLLLAETFTVPHIQDVQGTIGGGGFDTSLFGTYSGQIVNPEGVLPGDLNLNLYLFSPDGLPQVGSFLDNLPGNDPPWNPGSFLPGDLGPGGNFGFPGLDGGMPQPLSPAGPGEGVPPAAGTGKTLGPTTTGPAPGTGGVIGVGSIEDCYSVIRVPGETTEGPPPTTTPPESESMQCSPVKTIKTAAPDLRVKLERPDKLEEFPYPRPIPLQAVVRDFDRVEFQCEGCGGGTSKKVKYFEDAIAGTEWKIIQGEGRLNFPFKDEEDVAAIRARIKELTEQIADLEDRIKALKKKKQEHEEGLEEKRKQLREDIARLQAEKSTLEGFLLEMQSVIDGIRAKIAAEEQKIADARGKIALHRQEIEERKQRIEELERKIKGEPGPEEKRLAAELAAKQQEIKNKKARFEQLKQQNDSRARSLADAYTQALQQLQNARKQLDAARARVQAKQDEITALENSLYANSTLRNFITSRNRITRLGQNLKNYYFSGANLPPSPAKNLTDLATRFFRETDPTARRQLLDQVLAEKQRLLDDFAGRCGGLSSPADVNACRSGVEELEDELDGLTDNLQDNLARPPSGPTSSQWRELGEKQQELQQLGQAAGAAGQQVAAAEKAAREANRAYIDGLKQLEAEEARLQEEIRRLEEEAKELELQLTEARKRRERERERNLPAWLEEVAKLRAEIEQIEAAIAEEVLNIEAAQAEILKQEKELAKLLEKKKDLENQKNNKDYQIELKRKQLEQLNAKGPQLQSKIEDLEAEKRKLEEERRKLEKELVGLKKRHREAGGQLVYYIPPPLEFIMKNKPRFEELKTDLANKEIEYAEKKGEKAALQDQAFSILKDMNAQLWQLKAAKEAIAELEKEIDGLTKEKNELEADLKQEQQRQLQKEQKAKAELEKKRNAAKQKAEKAAGDEEAKRGEVNSAEGRVKAAEQKLSRAEEEVKTRTGGYRKDRERRLKKGKTLEQKKSAHEETVARLRDKESELARAQDALNRAVGADNEAAAANLRTRVKKLEQEKKQIEEEVAGEQQELSQLAEEFKTATTAEEQAKKQLDEAERRMLKAKQELRQARQELRRKIGELDQATERRLAAERKERQLDDAVKKQDEKIKQLNEELNQEIDENEEVQEKDGEIKEKEEEKKKLEGAKNTAEKNLNELVEKRKQWEKDRKKADEEIEKARKALEKAEKDLRNFLKVQEFEKPRFEVVIQLKVSDKVLDGWRTRDKPALRKIKIRYELDRKPKIEGPADKLSAPGESAKPDVCTPQVGFKPPPRLKYDPPPKKIPLGAGQAAGVEPQTIALYYRQGAPLYPEWPQVKPTGKLLSHASSSWGTGAGDSDEITYVCVGSGYGVTEQPPGGGTIIEYTPREQLLVYLKPGVDGGQYITENSLEGAQALSTPTGDVISVPVSSAGGQAIVDRLCSGGNVSACELDPCWKYLPAGEGAGLTGGGQCKSGPMSRENIADVTHSAWSKPRFFSSPNEHHVFIHVPEVTKPQCKAKPDLRVKYSDSGLQAADSEKAEKVYENYPGLLGSVRKVLKPFDGEEKTELTAQVFDGAHTGREDEKVVWKVENARPSSRTARSGDSWYGLEKDRKKTLDTETGKDGFASIEPGKKRHVDLYLGTEDERYGEVDVLIRWERGGEKCEDEKVHVKRLLRLRRVYVGFAPEKGWEQAEKLFTGEVKDVGKLAEALPDEGGESKVVFAAGLQDDQQEPVDEKEIRFELQEPAGAEMDPETMETRVYGLAWSFAQDVPEESEVKMTAEVHDKEIKNYTEPAEVEGVQSTKKEQRFRIGPKDAYLTIETDEPFVPGGDPVEGTGKLVIEGQGAGIPLEFKTLTLEISGVEVDAESGKPPIAVAGKVTWTPEGSGQNMLQFAKAGFELTLESLGLTAGADGEITGKIKVPKTEDEASFTALIGQGGFLGTVSDLPEIKIAEFKLEKGASVALDLHDSEDPDPLPANYSNLHALLIRQGRLRLPDAFKGRAAEPPVIGFKDFIIDPAGVSGEMSVEYTLTAGLGRLQFTIKEVSVNLKQNRIMGGSFKGGVVFPDPFVGEVSVAVMLQSGGDYAVEVSTEKPVSAPSLGLVFHLQKVAASYSNEVFTFQLSAILKSETFSDISIYGFEVNSNGDIKAEEIAINKDITFARGFSVHLKTFGFEKKGDEFGMSLDTKFQFADVLTAEQVAVSIATGPKIESFDLAVKGRREPVSFQAEVHYKENQFEGSLEVDVEKLFKINGTFVLGAQEKGGEETFTYWYIELSTRVAIPLGQTGLNIIELGGGIGYNYDPPVGSAGGAVRETNAFSFKAAIGVGNAPRGEVFAGRLTLVLVSGRFSINGKVWVLQREESLYGEGQLDIYWKPSSKLEGFVRMVVALPDGEGKILRFNGQVDFLFAGSSNWYIKSRTLKGAILERVKAEGKIDIKPGEAHLAGKVYYDLYKEIGLAVVTVKVEVHLSADGSLDFVVTESSASLDAQVRFRGSWDVNLDTAVKEFDIVAGSVGARLGLSATGRAVTVTGSVEVSWDTWVHSGSVDVDLGFTI